MTKKKLHIYYFSTALSDEIYDQIVLESRRFKPTFSGVGFDRNVAVGLSEQVEITGVSLYPIPSYPKYTKLRKESAFYTCDRFSCKVPAMLSLPIIKEYNYGISAYRMVKNMMREDEENIILVSGLYRSLLRPAKWLKLSCGVPVFAVVPDLPELMITYRKDYSKLRGVLNDIDMNRSLRYRKVVDGFVLLSSFMNPIVNRSDRPWTILDGLCNLNAIDNAQAVKSEERFILYAGKISRTFGVDILVEGFLKANLEGINLVLCGDGDYAPELREKVLTHKKIKFKGVVSHDTVLSLEKSATLLVDPRPIDNEIAKMSFPSKIIEYMASGTPVLVSNIPSFAPEYRQYQYRIEDVSGVGISEALKEVFQHTDAELIQMGQSARQFVFENKTIQKQCEKIIDLIKQVIE